jgi:hypothetical protein
MSPQFRKVALIAAALGLLVSLFVALRPDDDENAAGTTTAQTTTAATTTEPQPATTTEATTTTAPPPEPQVVRARIVVPADAASPVKKLSVQRDKELILVVEAEVADEVHVHGYDLTANVAPGQPATIRFKTSAPGIFEIELEERGLHIGELEVRP